MKENEGETEAKHTTPEHEMNISEAQTAARPTSAFLLLFYFTSHANENDVNAHT